MKLTLDELKRRLNEKNIHPSHQRLKVLEYLILHNTHPTADQIYMDLHREISTLSRTTVYNTLKIFVEAGLIKVITIESNEARYDIITESHGHFKCEACEMIYNFTIDVDTLDFSGLNHFNISEKSVYFRGLCPKCLGNINCIKED